MPPSKIMLTSTVRAGTVMLSNPRGVKASAIVATKATANPTGKMLVTGKTKTTDIYKRQTATNSNVARNMPNEPS